MFSMYECTDVLCLCVTRRDVQALSRAHRIGQKDKVLVLRLVTKSTVEEKIISIARRKMALECMVVNSMEDGKRKGTGLSVGEMQEILRHGAAEVMLLASQARVIERPQQPQAQAQQSTSVQAEGGEDEQGDDSPANKAPGITIPRELRRLQEETEQQERSRQARETAVAPSLAAISTSSVTKLSADEVRAILDRTEQPTVTSDNDAGGVLSSFKVDDSMRQAAISAAAKQDFGVTDHG
jgi:hypothetical protein